MWIFAVQIGCCYILQGNVNKGLDVIEKVENSQTHRPSLRALFEVDEFEKSKEYFGRFFEGDNESFSVYYYSNMDAFCKIYLMDVIPDVDKVEGGLKYLLPIEENKIEIT